jgi:hypothetical protein
MPVTRSDSDILTPAGLLPGFCHPVTDFVTGIFKNFIWNIAQKFRFGQDITRFVDIIILTNGYKIVILAKVSVNIPIQ